MLYADDACIVLLSPQKLERIMATLVDLTFSVTVSERNGDHELADPSTYPHSGDRTIKPLDHLFYLVEVRDLAG